MSEDKISAIERLEELLDAKDSKLHDALNKNEQLERELRGSLDGWRTAVELPDDDLPVPRLELVYTKDADRGWRHFKIVYRLVVKHLLGRLIGIPLSYTRCDSGSSQEPDSLPFRDGAHAMHDSAHLRCPVYKLMPDKPPQYISSAENYASQIKQGKEHRRE